MQSVPSITPAYRRPFFEEKRGVSGFCFSIWLNSKVNLEWCQRREYLIVATKPGQYFFLLFQLLIVFMPIGIADVLFLKIFMEGFGEVCAGLVGEA